MLANVSDVPTKGHNLVVIVRPTISDHPSSDHPSSSPCLAETATNGAKLPPRGANRRWRGARAAGRGARAPIRAGANLRWRGARAAGRGANWLGGGANSVVKGKLQLAFTACPSLMLSHAC